MRNALLAIAWLTVSLAAYACGGGGDSSDSSEPTPAAEPTLAAQPAATASLGSQSAPCFDQSLHEDALDSLPSLADAPGRIAFVCEGQIWTMRPDGSDHVQVTQPTEIDYANVSLFRVPEEQPPTDAEVADLKGRMNSSPAWSTGGEIFFASIRDTLALSAEAGLEERRPFVGASELYVVQPDGSELRRITDYNLVAGSYPGQFEPAVCPTPDFCHAGVLTVAPIEVSPDGDQLAMIVTEIRFSECCHFATRLDLGSSDFIPLEPGPGEPEAGFALAFSWSGSGDQGVLYLWRGNNLGGPYFEELAILGLDDDSSTVLVRAGDGEEFVSMTRPAWSPTDDRIAFCARSESTFEAAYTLYVGTASGSDLEMILTLDPGSESTPPVRCEPRWSPDGRFLTFGNGQAGILIVDSETGDSVVLSLGSQPAWGPAD